MKGIDVSKHNGTIDYTKVAASGLEFVIIRAGYGNDIRQKDKNFEANIEGALAAGLHVGIYWFSYADSPEDAKREWAVCKQIISPYKDKITFPVAFDYEYDSANYYEKIHGKQPSNHLINQIADAFLSSAAADGYKPMLYTNHDYRLNKFFPEIIAKYPLWLADYSGRSAVSCAIQQTCSDGTVDGISGNVDMDTAYVNDTVPKTIVEIDTTMDVAFARGTYYIVRTTSPQPVKLTYGTGDVVTIVRFPRTGNDQLFAIVPIGHSGQETGIYTAAPGEKPLRRFVFRIK